MVGKRARKEGVERGVARSRLWSERGCDKKAWKGVWQEVDCGRKGVRQEGVERGVARSIANMCRMVQKGKQVQKGVWQAGV